MSKPIDDPDAPPTAEEIAEAEKLRDALADPRMANEAAELARAAALAHAPREIAEAEHRAIVDRAIAQMAAKKPHARPRGRVIPVAFGVAAALSMAAAALLAIGSQRDAVHAERAEALEPLAPARSTQNLFHEPFSGSGSARIDRIARARAEDLRDNRFAMRGVR